MSAVAMKDVSKVYSDALTAVSDINFEIEEKQVVAIVGLSGSGKSTILKMIAGLEDVTKGEIYINGEIVNDLKPENRDVAIIFPNDTLYPNMTVRMNIEFSLKIREFSESDIEKHLDRISKKLKIENILDKKTDQLSEVEKQRALFAKAMTTDPTIILFDEPFLVANYDDRKYIREDFINLHRHLQKTFLYTTSDPIDALKTADKIIIIKDGKIQQMGTADELKLNPVNVFVANFIWKNKINMIYTSLHEEKGEYYLSLGDSKIKLIKNGCIESYLKNNVCRDVILGALPKDVLVDSDNIETFNYGTVNVELKGRIIDETGVYVMAGLNGIDVWCKCKEEFMYEFGKRVDITFNMNNIHLFDRNTEKLII